MIHNKMFNWETQKQKDAIFTQQNAHIIKEMLDLTNIITQLGSTKQ